MTEDDYLQHREHCLLMADAAPTERVRASLLRMARLYEIEGRLIKHSTLRLSERAAIAKVDTLLRGADALLRDVTESPIDDGAAPPPAAPYPATAGQAADTSAAALHR